MSYNTKADDFTALLEGVWQDVTSVEKAPKTTDLAFNAQEESEKEYKAINSIGLFIVQNPALMKWQADQHCTVITRRKPKFAMSLADVKSGKFKYRHQSFTSDDQRGSENLDLR